MLSKLSIHRYRCFKHLELDNLGRVNLIVGQNNVGKTTLLEAILFHLGASAPDLAIRPFQFRRLPHSSPETWEWLFHGRDLKKEIAIAM